MGLINFDKHKLFVNTNSIASSTKKLLLNIFSNEELKKYIESGDFDKAYDYFDNNSGFFNSWLTSILLLSDIDMLKYLSKIPSDCFSDLPILNIIIPINISEIGTRAFSSIKTLDTIYIPKTVKFIDWYAFAYSNIKEINFEVSKEEVYNIFNNRVSVYRFKAYLGVDDSVKLNFNVKRD